MSFSFSCLSFGLIILPSCLDTLTLRCKNACTTGAAVSSLLEAFHLRLHLRASAIAQWHQHLQTPAVLIRLRGNFERNTKGMLFASTVRKDVLWDTRNVTGNLPGGWSLPQKSPFQQSRSVALRVSHASSHAAEDCRAAEHYRCQGANVVYHITSLSLFYLSQCFTSGPWKAERLRWLTCLLVRAAKHQCWPFYTGATLCQASLLFTTFLMGSFYNLGSKL